MKKHVFLALTALTSAALALPLVAQAQAQQPAAAASAAKHAVKKKVVREKAEHKRSKKGVSHKHAKAIEAKTPVQTPTERLTDDELQTAQQVYTGAFPCEQGERVTVAADTQHPGFFTVASGKRRYYMHPVESRTGAIRLEDNFHGAVWLQLGSKSMLMDQKIGQRVADDCETQAQKDYAAEHQQHHLLDSAASEPPAAAASQTPPSQSSSDGAQSPDNAASAP
ncbi:MAG: hypothetical protein LBH10_01875 [Burkholderiaceae bacterium]|nr:hypothetical protein [Burkholderiaceae bacterium]